MVGRGEVTWWTVGAKRRKERNHGHEQQCGGRWVEGAIRGLHDNGKIEYSLN